MEDKRIILASGSPRRKILLEQIGLIFDTVISEVDESIPPAMLPEKAVALLAKRKVNAVGEKIDSSSIIIGADTVVSHNKKVLGKPSTKEEAYQILKALQNDDHEVYTGLFMIDLSSNLSYSDVVCTEVYMRSISDQEIWDYIHTGEPMDKAGAYGIQGKGSLFIEKIIGDYYNVVGLPLVSLHKGFQKIGIDYKDYAK